LAFANWPIFGYNVPQFRDLPGLPRRIKVIEQQDENVFSAGKARWLIQHIDELDEDARALLLAMVELDKEIGRQLTDEERAAVEKLGADTQGFGADKIQHAVQQMVGAQAKHQPAVEWPSGLGRKIERAQKK
jgi:hypothetical protein